MADRVFVISEASWEPSGATTDSQWLPCPVCGERYGHVYHVSTEIDPAGDENGDGRYVGTTTTVERANGFRRPAVRIDIDGECGHIWTLLVQQHKGALMLLARIAG